MRFVLTLCLIAACYSPNTPAGRPCTTALNNCPDGQACMGNVCLLADGEPPGPDGDAGPPTVTDGDGDGTANEVDNCPTVANPDQADEDGDKIGDACDGCAHLADAPLVDGDADGIGDACDPNPAAMDVRWAFEGFHGTELPPWGPTPGWSIRNDALFAMAAGNLTSEPEYFAPAIRKTGRSFDKFSMSSTVVIDATQGDDGLHEVGYFYFDSRLNLSLACAQQQLGTDTNNRGIAIEEWDEGDENNPRTQRGREATKYVWRTGAEYRLTFARQGRSYTCTIAGPEGTRTVTVMSDVAPDFEPELDAFGANVQVHSVLVIGPPP